MINVFNVSVRESDVLWIGDDLVKSYQAQEVSINLDGYSLLIIMCRDNIGTYVSNVVVNDSDSGALQLLTDGGNSFGSTYRYVEVKPTGLSFSNEFTGTTGEAYTANSSVIPCIVYGIR